MINFILHFIFFLSFFLSSYFLFSYLLLDLSLSPSLSFSANILNVIQCGVSWLGHIFFLYLTRPHHLNQRFPFHMPVNKVRENTYVNKIIKL